MDSIFPPRETELVVRNVHDTRRSEGRLVPKAVSGGIPDCPVISLLRYEDETVQACIQEAKFHGNRDAVELLGAVLREFLFELGEEVVRPVIIPLPLSRARLRERGYNQTTRIVMAACSTGATRQINMEIDGGLLVRVRNTAPQTQCSGNERKTNMLNAFAVTKACDPLRTYIVVDDVITTGNTMLAAVEALKAGGAARLLLLTLAY